MDIKFCKDSGCHYFDGFGCDRSPVVKENEERCSCDEREAIQVSVGDIHRPERVKDS